RWPDNSSGGRSGTIAPAYESVVEARVRRIEIVEVGNDHARECLTGVGDKGLTCPLQTRGIGQVWLHIDRHGGGRKGNAVLAEGHQDGEQPGMDVGMTRRDAERTTEPADGSRQRSGAVPP